jgi:hypothetical protein
MKEERSVKTIQQHLEEQREWAIRQLLGGEVQPRSMQAWTIFGIAAEVAAYSHSEFAARSSVAAHSARRAVRQGGEASFVQNALFSSLDAVEQSADACGEYDLLVAARALADGNDDAPQLIAELSVYL